MGEAAAAFGVRVGVDVGSVRVGVAVSDPTGTLASPLTVLRRDQAGDADVAQIALIVHERGAVGVVVGLPRHLSGAEGQAVALARGYAARIAQAVAPVPVRLVDERLSTVSADRSLRAASPRSRAPGRRQRVDAAAAAVVLQGALETERTTGAPAGEAL